MGAFSGVPVGDDEGGVAEFGDDLSTAEGSGRVVQSPWMWMAQVKRLPSTPQAGHGPARVVMAISRALSPASAGVA